MLNVAVVMLFFRKSDLLIYLWRQILSSFLSRFVRLRHSSPLPSLCIYDTNISHQLHNQKITISGWSIWGPKTFQRQKTCGIWFFSSEVFTLKSTKEFPHLPPQKRMDELSLFYDSQSQSQPCYHRSATNSNFTTYDTWKVGVVIFARATLGMVCHTVITCHKLLYIC